MVGVGGAGVNAVNRMIEAEVTGVEFIALNTDAQSLNSSAAHVTLQLGADITRGLGSGSDPDQGRSAAMEDYDRIKSLLKGADMVFITAGEGGGTGTGAAPVVARIARELGALTVGIVTKPFGFEGSRRMKAAEQGIEALGDEVDTLIVVPNNRLLSVLDKQTSMVEAFRVADDVLRQGVQGVSDLITLPGLINLDFADVRTIMSDAGSALLGIGMGTGDKRAIERRARGRLVAAAGDDARGRQVDPAVDHRRARPVAVGGQRGGPCRPGGRAPGREHHLRRDARREARGRGVDHRGRHRLRREARAARRAQRRSASRSASRECTAPGPPARAGVRRRRRARSSFLRLSEVSRVARPRRRRGRPPADRGGRRGVLRAGGNAVDAALAAMLTVVRHRAAADRARRRRLHARGARRAREPVLLDFFVEAPGRGADPERRAPLVAGRRLVRRRGAGVQRRRLLVRRVRHAGGDLRGRRALRHACRWPSWSRPPIALARDGVPINDVQAYLFEILEPIFSATPEARAVFMPEGRVPRAGDVLHDPRARRRARAARRRGRRAVLHGDIGAVVSDCVCERGGTLTREDLAAYRAEPREPGARPLPRP